MAPPDRYAAGSAKHPKFATVLVGPNQDKFTIHEELLTVHSPYFRAALTGGFKEAQDKIVTLKEDRGGIFEFFVHWLYYLRFPTEDDATELYAAWTADNDCNLKTDNLIQLYVFCDKYNVPEQNTKTMTQIFNHVEQEKGEALPPAYMIHFAFNNLMDNVLLCNYLVHAYYYWAHDSLWKDFESTDWPPCFIARVFS